MREGSRFNAYCVLFWIYYTCSKTRWTENIISANLIPNPNSKQDVHKKRLQSRGFVQCVQEGGLQMRTFAHLGAKNIFCGSARTRREEGRVSADILRTRGGVKFSRFCADVFYGRPPTLNPTDQMTLLFE